jgi:tetratricopeptide (TPR) repeat protein
LPRDFWHDEQMVAALLSPEFGAVIRAFRLHPYWRSRPHPAQRRAWLSQELVAGWLNISQEKLSRIESGTEHVWDLRDLTHYARVLGLPQPAACLGTLDGLLPFAPSTPVDPLDRRALLSRAVALALAARPTPLPDAAAKVDPERVQRSLQMLGVLADQDNVFGPRAATDVARYELATTSRERQVARGGLQTRLLRVEARWAEFAGWLSDDAGDAQAADYWMDRAMTMSQDSGDRLMTSYILMRHSQRASERGDAQRTVALAQAAQQRPRTLTPAVHALSAVREAQGHALASDAAACQSKLDEAHRVLDDRADHTAGGPFDTLGTHYATHTYVTVHEAQCWAWLGRHDRAAATLSGALASWPAALHRDAGLHQARLARAYATDGQPDRAAHDGVAALKIARSTKSARIMVELGMLDRQLSEHVALPATREFRDIYAAASAAPR